MLNSAPRNAAIGTHEISPRNPLPKDKSQFGKKISPNIPPSEAPPETPSICGQASGWRSRAWGTVPQAAMPPPMATPKRTRGRRARKNISASGFAENIFCKACQKSRRTGPSRAQPTTESANKANSTPLTKIIFLRSRTFTATSFIQSAFGVREALRMHEAGDCFQTLADARSGPQDFVGRIGVDAPLFYGGNGLEIAPMFGRLAAVRSHASLDDHLRRFCHHVLVG